MLKDSFHIEKLGNPEPTARPLSLNDHQIFLLTNGKLSIRIDEHRYALAAGSLLLIAKGQVFAIDSGSEFPEGYRLQFGDCFWQRTPASASNCKAVLFDDPDAGRLFLPGREDLASLKALLQNTLQEFEAPEYSNKADALAAYLKIITIKIANIHALLQKEIATYDGRLYQDYQLLVRSQYNAAHDVSFFAQQLGVTTRKLAAICKAHGSSAKELIVEQLISEAKRSLQFSPRSIKEIASLLGFSSPYQFSSFFKTHTQLSPLDYRRRSHAGVVPSL